MTRVQANLLLILVAAIWGTGNVAQQSVLEHIGPLLANGLKSLIAIPVLLPLLMRRNTAPRPMDAAGWRLAIAVVVTYVLGTTSAQIGFGLTTVSNAGFMMETATVIAPIFAWWLLRQRPDGVIFLAAFVTFAGVVNVGGGSLSTLNPGDIISLGTAVCFAIWVICLGEFVQRYGRAGWLSLGQFSAAAVICVSSATVIEPISVSAVVAALPLLLFLGVVDAGLASCLQTYAQRHTSSSEAAVLISIEAVFGAIFAVLILNERLNDLAIMGGLLVMTGIVLVQIAPRRVSKSGVVFGGG